MTMRFGYRRIRVASPVTALGGRFVRPRPILSVSLMGATTTVTRNALLDSAADECIFPELVAQAIGVDLSATVAESVTYVRFGNINVRRGVVTLRLSDGIETREWQALVAFTPVRLIYPILGFAGCLQYFDTTFRGAIEEIEMSTNALYSGS